MSQSDIKKVKSSALVSVLVHGANELGLQLSMRLHEQGSRIIVIDKFSTDNKEHISRIKKIPNTDFIAFEGIEELLKNIKRFDYLFYLQNDLLTLKEDFRSKDFLDESNYLDIALKAALKFDSKTALITSLSLNKRLAEEQMTQNNAKLSPYSSIEIQRYSETLVAEYHDRSKLNARIIRIGSILGRSFEINDDPSLNEILVDSVKKDRITIFGEGLDLHYLIHAEDLVYGILKLTFSQETQGEVISLANPKPLTTLSIAYKLLELNTNATNIVFKEDEKDKFFMQSQYTPAPNAEKYGWIQKITLEKALIEVIENIYSKSKKKWSQKPSEQIKPLQAETREAELKKKKESTQVVKTDLGKAIDKLILPFRKFLGYFKLSQKKQKPDLNWKNIGIFLILLSILSVVSYFFFTPIASLAYNGYKIYGLSKEAYSNTREFRLDEAHNQLDEIERRFSAVENSTQRLEWAFDITQQEELYQNFTKMVFAGKYAAKGANDMAVALNPLAQYIDQFEPAISFDSRIPTTTREYRDYLEQLRSNRSQLDKASYNISLASNILEEVDTNSFPAKVRPYVNDIKRENLAVQELLNPIKGIITFIPELLGVDERQRYLILLQNPSELRSTGGWLSSYAIIGIEGGQIRQLEVDDIYNIDGQLSVEGKTYTAPVSMQSALGLENWSLSLSNWSPNFDKASKDAEFFIKEAGKASSIDGAIALDITVIQDLLDRWGGISVPGETELITRDNLYSKIFEIHREFTPGSTQKTTFIANLANEVIKRALSDKNEYSAIFQSFYKGLEGKHVLISLRNREANKYLEDNSWTGQVSEDFQSAPFAVEWNWGANKANLFIERNVNLRINVLSEEEITYTYSLDTKNNSETDLYPEGDYINRARVYLPEQAQITSVSGMLDNQYDTYLEDGFKIVSGWFNTPIRSSNSLTVTYSAKQTVTRGFPIKVEGDNIYMDLHIYKQPGTDPYRQTIDIIYPDNWAVTDSSELNHAISSLTGQLEMKKDKKLNIAWEYK